MIFCLAESTWLTIRSKKKQISPKYYVHLAKAGYRYPGFLGVLDCPGDNKGAICLNLLEIQVLGP